MKVFIACLIATLAVAAQGSYVPSAAWPVNSLGWNSWNGLNSWNDHSHIVSTYPYGSWPATSLYNNGWYGARKTIVEPVMTKVAANPWGLGSYGYGYNNYHYGAGPVVAAKYVAANPGAVHVAPLAGHAINQKLIVA